MYLIEGNRMEGRKGRVKKRWKLMVPGLNWYFYFNLGYIILFGGCSTCCTTRTVHEHHVEWGFPILFVEMASFYFNANEVTVTRRKQYLPVN